MPCSPHGWDIGPAVSPVGFGRAVRLATARAMDPRRLVFAHKPSLQPTNDGPAAGGIEIDAVTGTPSWGGEPLDLDWAMHVLWRPCRDPPAP